MGTWYFAGFVLAVGILYGVSHRLGAWWAVRNAMKQSADFTHCPACSGTVLSKLGPDYYRCEACGIPSGTGLAAIKRARRMERLQHLSSEARIAFAVNKLDRAEEHFYFAQQWLAPGNAGVVSNLIFGPGITDGGPGADVRNDALVACQREATIGSRHLGEACDALGRAEEGSFVPDIDHTLMWADDFFDHAEVDHWAVDQVGRVQDNMKEALKYVRALRAEITQP